MVVQFEDKCIDCNHVCSAKCKDMELFVQKFNVLSKDEVAVAMMVTSKDVMNLLTHLVPCVGCRRRYICILRIVTANIAFAL